MCNRARPRVSRAHRPPPPQTRLGRGTARGTAHSTAHSTTPHSLREVSLPLTTFSCSISQYVCTPSAPCINPLYSASTSVLGQSLDCALAPCCTRLPFLIIYGSIRLSSSTPSLTAYVYFAFIIPETAHCLPLCPFYSTNCFTKQANHPLL